MPVAEPAELAEEAPELPEAAALEASAIAAEEWLPEPEPIAEEEISIEDWLPELEPAEIAAAMTEETTPAPEEAVTAEEDIGVRAIFAEEARGHLASVRAWLQTAGDTADEPLVRSVHTLRGGAHVAELKIGRAHV